MRFELSFSRSHIGRVFVESESHNLGLDFGVHKDGTPVFKKCESNAIVIYLKNIWEVFILSVRP